MEKALARIVAWLRANVPELARDLQPGANEQTLADVEAKLGFALPAPLRVLWSTHDGSREATTIGYRYLMSAQQAAAEQPSVKMFVEMAKTDVARSGSTAAELASTRWVAFAGQGLDYLAVCVDTGRVFEAMKDVPSIRLAANSIVEYFERYAFQLEAGKYRLSEEYAKLEPPRHARADALALRLVNALRAQQWLALDDTADAQYAVMDAIADAIRSTERLAAAEVAEVIIDCDGVDELFADDKQLAKLWKIVQEQTPK